MTASSSVSPCADAATAALMAGVGIGLGRPSLCGPCGLCGQPEEHVFETFNRMRARRPDLVVRGVEIDRDRVSSAR